MQNRLTVVILAAGLGTRMRSRKAKVLHRAGGKALVEHVVETALALTTPERVFVVVGHQADEVRRAVATPTSLTVSGHQEHAGGSCGGFDDELECARCFLGAATR